jgi:hypothetical protein
VEAAVSTSSILTHTYWGIRSVCICIRCVSRGGCECVCGEGGARGTVARSAGSEVGAHILGPPGTQLLALRVQKYFLYTPQGPHGACSHAFAAPRLKVPADILCNSGGWLEWFSAGTIVFACGMATRLQTPTEHILHRQICRLAPQPKEHK